MMGLVLAGRYGLKSGTMENDGPGPGSLRGHFEVAREAVETEDQ